MAFDGSGTFDRLYNWVADRDAAVPITASRMDGEMDGMATGLSNCITKDGQTTVTANLPMATFKHTGVGNASARDQYLAAGQFQDGTAKYAVGAGTANAQTVTLTPAITAYADGMVVNFKAGETNTGAMTLNVNSVGADSLVMPNGDAPPAGAVTSGNFYTAIYDLTNTQWILMDGNHIHAGINVIADDTTTDAVSIVSNSLTSGSSIDITSSGKCISMTSTATGFGCVEVTSSSTTGNVNVVTADSLTTGSALSISSNSSSTGTRNLVELINDNASSSNTTVLDIRQDSSGKSLNIVGAQTGGDCVFIQADSLTNGSALSVYSNSSSTGSRNVAEVNNDNSSATGAICLALNNDANQRCLFATSANTTEDNVVITSNSITTGSALSVTSNSSSSSTRSLVSIVNDNTSATNAACISIQQDSTARGIEITTANSRGLEIISGATTADSLAVNADSLTTGTCIRATSNSSDSSTRNLVEIVNDNTSATATTCLTIDHDAATSPLIRVNSNNASYADNMQRMECDRSASSSYHFLAMLSNGSSDIEFRFRGDGNGFCDGSFTGGGADYAEYFEWEDGNPMDEDRRGMSVELVGNKIRPSQSESSSFGVISGNPSVVGDAAWNKWDGKYLTDEFGSYVMEEYDVWSWTQKNDKGIDEGMVFDADKIPQGINVPENKEVVVQTRRKLNPLYNPDLEYIPRENRKEWGCVGLMGKLRIRKGQPVNPNWIKMRDISDEVEEWLVR